MQKSSVNQKSKMFKLSISPTFRKTKYFVFRNKKYPFDYDIFNKNSYFFVENKNQYDNVEYIDLFNEKESEVFQNITDKAITDFISLMQNKECQIDISDIHYIQYLSQKFKAETLSQDISNMISIHANELVLDHLLFKLEINKQNNDDFLILSEDIISVAKNLIKFVNEDRIIKMPIQNLYQILTEYYSRFYSEKNSCEEEELSIINFLFRCIEKVGSDASILFSIHSFEKHQTMIIKRLLRDYSNVFKFDLIPDQLLTFSIHMSNENRQMKSIDFFQFSLDMNLSFEHSDEERLNLNLTNIKHFRCYQNYSKMAPALKFSEVKNFEFSTEIFNKKIQSSTYEILSEDSSINSSTFYPNCTSITKLVIPSSVKTIGSGAFQNLTFLEEVEFNPCSTSFDSNAFDKCKTVKHLIISHLATKIERFNINHREQITSIAIPSSVMFICSNAFEGFKSLVNIEIPPSVSSICSYVFANCSSLKHVSLPSSIVSIEEHAFDNCISLSQISIPSSVTSIEPHSFKNCSSLKNISIPTSIKSIGDYAFSGCSSLLEFQIQPSVESVGSYAFSDCSSLTRVEIQSNLFSIDDYMFANCSSLKQIRIPSSVLSIGNFAFSCCSSLTDLAIPPSVTSIGDNAFSECSSLTMIKIPSSIEMIGHSIFSKCSSLKEAEISSSIPSINKNLFMDCSSLCRLVIPSSVVSIEENGFYGCSLLNEIIIPQSVKIIKSYAFYGCNSLIEITIPSSVTSICSHAFSNCSSLIKVDIQSDLKSIASNTFFRCSSLKQINMPQSVESIESNSFYKCSSLVQIEIPISVTSISENAFCECSSLKQITIPQLVETIGKNAFSGCSSLNQVEILSSLKSISEYVFSGCSSLIHISIPYSVADIKESAFLWMSFHHHC